MKRKKSYIAHKIDSEYRLKKKYERLKRRKLEENIARLNENKKQETLNKE